jgi:hypothetical protein
MKKDLNIDILQVREIVADIIHQTTVITKPEFPSNNEKPS